MKLKIIIPILLCLSLLAMPAAAEDFAPTEKNAAKETGYIYLGGGIYFTKADIKEAAAEIRELINDYSLTSTERLDKYPEHFGYDARLHHFMTNESMSSAETSEGSGNPFFDWIGGIINSIVTIFAGQPVEIENPYNETAGQEAWNNYLASYIAGYEPSGEFGGPIQ